MGAAGASAQSRVDGLLSDLERSQQAIDEIGKENNFLKHLLNEAVARTDEVNERRKEQLGIIHQLQQENDDLKAAFANKKPE
jgi:chromosome segregation ATPase